MISNARTLFFKTLCLLLWFFCLSLLPVLAETIDTSKFTAWNGNINQAKRLLEQQDITIRELENLRQQLVNQREEAQRSAGHLLLYLYNPW